VTDRLLGLDPGERRIGVAISDASGTIASPVEYIDVKAMDHEQRLTDLCVEWEISEIVVGLPLSLDGTEGPAATKAREFGRRVAQVTGISVAYHDERFTTVTAEQALLEGGVKRRSRTRKRDQIAAAVMLQGFLDRRRYRHGNDIGSDT
jgi:putative Holliday junction resolvase